MSKPKLGKSILQTLFSLVICSACAKSELAHAPSTILSASQVVQPTETQVRPVIPPASQAPTISEVPTKTASEFPTGEFFNSSFVSTLTITKYGKWKAVGNDMNIRGKYMVDGKRVTFIEESTWCGVIGDGVYTWEFEDSILYLNIIEDQCDTRVRWLSLPYKER